MKTVELHPAAVWDCDECGVENFCRHIKPEMIDRDQTVSMLMEEMDIPQFEAEKAADNGEWVIAPSEVKCRSCGAVFATQEMNENS